MKGQLHLRRLPLWILLLTQTTRGFVNRVDNKRTELLLLPTQIRLQSTEKNFKKALTSLSATPPDQPSQGDLPGPDDVTEETIRSLFALWTYALATGEPRIVAKRYSKDAVLMPSISDEPLMDLEAIEEYYKEYLPQKPRKRILEGRIKIGHGWAEDAGIYEIRLLEAKDGNKKAFKARYSFVYVWEDHQWKILHHHSSIMREDMPDMDASNGPEQGMRGMGAGMPGGRPGPGGMPMGLRPSTMRLLSPEKVENLFQFFNDAMDTLDADAVTRRFSRKAVVFPIPEGPQFATTPKISLKNIKEYFEELLQHKPQAKVIERHIVLDPSPIHPTAKDVGTLEWTFRHSDSEDDIVKVKARYTLDFIIEDDQWKIVYLQSSPLPEGFTSTEAEYQSSVLSNLKSSFERSITETDVLRLFDRWNEALATKNPEMVTALYTAYQPVLMPTLSEEPLTTHSQIQDFYQTFLYRQPQAKIVSSHISLPPNVQWCKNVGILEFTFRDASTNQPYTIRERFSFLYVLEDGSWKIAHHHASPVPPELSSGNSPMSSKGMDIGRLPQNPSRKQDPWQ